MGGKKTKTKTQLILNFSYAHKLVLHFYFQSAFIYLQTVKKKSHRDCGVQKIISLLFHGLTQKGKRSLSFKKSSNYDFVALQLGGEEWKSLYYRQKGWH